MEFPAGCYWPGLVPGSFVVSAGDDVLCRSDSRVLLTRLEIGRIDLSKSLISSPRTPFRFRYEAQQPL
jgi:hypothetical protein